jgi:Fe-S-cluster containining protein
MDDEALYDAGDFGSWIKSRLDPATAQDVVVACGNCTACCTTFEGITIHHDETETLAAISTFHLTSDTRFANGSKILIANPDHTCPMLVRGKCSIYPVRPRAC